MKKGKRNKRKSISRFATVEQRTMNMKAVRSLGLRRGGILDVVARDLECIVSGDNIPEKVRVNLGPYMIGDKIRAKSIEVCPATIIFHSSKGQCLE